MDFKGLLSQLTPNWTDWLFIAIRLIFIAVVFEFLAWWAGRKFEMMTTPFLGLDQNREASWRTRRRTTLKTAPKLVARLLLYTVAIILVFSALKVPVLELSLSVAAVAGLLGVALIPIMRDYAQGYVLLSEDSLAPGDFVEIDGHQGQVEKWTLRATWLRDNSGRLHVLSNRDIKNVVIFQKATTKPEAGEKSKAAKSANGAAFDPLAETSSTKR